MAITLIQETGAIVADANTYGTLAGVIAYAANREVVLPNTDATAAKLIKAMDYLFGLNYKGVPVSPGVQTLDWPRSGAVIDGYAQPENLIPSALVRAQYQLVLEIASGIDIMPTVSGGFIKREKVGPIETEYSESLAASNGLGPDMPIVDSLLASLLNTTGKFSLTTYRV